MYRKSKSKVEKKCMRTQSIEFEELEQPEEAYTKLQSDPETVVKCRNSNRRPTKFLGKHKSSQLNKSSFSALKSDL
jgi:hypothetical protein